MPDRVDSAGNTVLDPPVQVEVLFEGERWCSGWATAYRGERVSVRFTTGLGEQRVRWEPAVNVRRVGGPTI